jgi:hypothetical protein
LSKKVANDSVILVNGPFHLHGFEASTDCVSCCCCSYADDVVLPYPPLLRMKSRVSLCEGDAPLDAITLFEQERSSELKMKAGKDGRIVCLGGGGKGVNVIETNNEEHSLTFKNGILSLKPDCQLKW